MNLREFRDMLLTALPGKVFHNEAYQQSDNYLVWYEVGKKSLRADNKTAENCHRIAVDYFTKKEYDEFPAELEVIFEDNEIAYDDVEIMYEEDTNYTHYAWSLEVT